MTVDELIAQAQIRQTMVNYNIAGDLHRKDEAAAQFVEDGVLKFAAVIARGRAQIMATLQGHATSRPGEAAQPTTVRHNLTTSQVLVNGNEATGRTYFLVITEQGPAHQGVYLDTFRKVDGRWLIAEREVRVEWRADNSARGS